MKEDSVDSTGSADDVVVTIAENDLFIGASVLLNSLVNNGFSGRFVVGTKGNSPDRVKFLCRSQHLCEGNQIAGIEIIDLETNWHLANCKPELMVECFERYPHSQITIYFDPDIVVDCPWEFLRRWSFLGVALAADVNHWMPSRHPTRLEWQEMLHSQGHIVHQKFDSYFNSGFLGLHRRSIALVKLWHELTVIFGECDVTLRGVGDIGTWRIGGRWQRIMSPSQDTLNMAAMATETVFSPVGPDAMGFCGGDNFIPHAIGPRKPWRSNYLLNSFRGIGPRKVDIKFWQHADFPVRVFPGHVTWWKSFSIKIASFVRRFYSRG